MSYKLNRGTAVNVTPTPTLLFSSPNYARIFYRFTVPTTATSSVLVMALPIGSPTPVQADLIAGADWVVQAGQSLEDNIRDMDIYVCLLNSSGTVAIIPKEGIV